MQKLPSTTRQSIAKIEKKNVCKIIFKINLLVPYPLTDRQIEDWSNEIVRLCPQTSPEDLLEIIDKFMVGRYVWDNKSGIQNMFKAIKHFENEKIKRKNKLIEKWNFEGKPYGISFEDYSRLQNPTSNP